MRHIIVARHAQTQTPSNRAVTLLVRRVNPGLFGERERDRETERDRQTDTDSVCVCVYVCV